MDDRRKREEDLIFQEIEEKQRLLHQSEVGERWAVIEPNHWRPDHARQKPESPRPPQRSPKDTPE
jgi:hypothetical protein